MDDEHFETFFKAHFTRACRFAAGMVGPDEAEDAAQQAFYKLYLKRSSLSEDRSSDAYFYTILTRLCLNILRRRKIWTRIRMLVQPGRVETRAPDLLHTREAWHTLSPREKLVFLLLNFICLDTDRAARILNVTPSTLRVLRHRLNKKIEKWEVSS